MILTLEKMQEELQGWSFLEELPEKVGSFVRVDGFTSHGQELSMVRYVNEAQHRSLDLTYTSETGDFVPVKTVGLHVFRDIKYFYRDKNMFAAAVLEGLASMIASIDNEVEHDYSCEAVDYHFKDWEYGMQLPRKIGSYELFISPANPISSINGSFIFIDYTDFTEGNQLCFFYNVYRNEIFAEKKQHYLPITTNEFTVMNKKLPKSIRYRTSENLKKDNEGKLGRLEALLKEKLVQTLESL